MSPNTAVKRRSDEEIELESLHFFLHSLQREINERFHYVTASVSNASSIPQLVLRKR